jgi:protein-S-isoprenylcysteine O-methyltransferase Ste14
MNIQLRAVIRTAQILFTCVAISAVTAFIFANVSAQNIMIGFGILFAFLGVYLIYSISLGQLKYEEKLKEMVDSK